MLRLCAVLGLTVSLTACVTASDDRYVLPAHGQVLPSANESIRIKTDGRTRVTATRTGRVLYAGKGENGRLVVLDHGGGIRSRYHGLQRVSVAKGEWIRSGKPVGWVGGRGDATAELGFGLSLAEAKLDPMTVIEVPKTAQPPKVRVRIDDQAGQLDLLVSKVAEAPAADKYGPKPAGAGLVVKDDGPTADAGENGYAPGYDKYGALPTGTSPAP
jgi:murein DD-endopeptidase MepM/ murein hydrolase activator NlpD